METANFPSRGIYLSTEDPETIDVFANLSNFNPPWEVFWQEDDREPYRVRSTAPFHESVAEQRGWHKEVVSALSNLDLNLQCQGFVAQLSSNWARVIDELRSTVRCKANRPFLDVELGWHPIGYKV